MKKYSFQLCLALAFLASSCEEMQYNRVLIVVTDATALVPEKSGTALLKGEILDIGLTPLTSYGFCLMDSLASAGLELHIETAYVQKVTLTDKPTIGKFESKILSLDKNTTYVYRAFARTATQTKYGRQYSFRMGDIIATIYKGSVSNITKTEASIKGSVSETKFTSIASQGGSIVQHGHCWSTEPDPDINDNKTNLGTLTEAKEFESKLSGLVSGREYFIRTYITYTHGSTTLTEYSSNDNELKIKTQ
jgi:hypothetical protein